MIIDRVYDELLAQAGYVAAAEGGRRCIVIDPHRDIRAYVRAAEHRRLQIAAVVETHIHADFVSGARALARETGAQLILSGAGWPEWSYRLREAEEARFVRDGDSIDVDELSLRVRHTPGHTPEHIVLIATDTTRGPQPVGMFAGDFLFAGDVGRPDLLERAANEHGTMELLARDLFHSLQALADLPDYLQIWPGHGAGSACGKSLDATPATTLGYERLINWAFHGNDEDVFVRDVLARQNEPPGYFARMKQLNRDAPPDLEPPRALATLSAAELDAAMRAGDTIIDVRASGTFSKGHVPGSLNIPLGGSFASWAGTLVAPDARIVIVSDAADRMSAARHALSLIGIDGVTAWAGLPTLQEWADARGLVTGEHVAAAEFSGQHDARVIDVRGSAEWRAGHLPGATHIYLGDLPERAAELPRDEPIVVHCQGGSRASIAASLLRAHGFTNVRQLDGGFSAWKHAGLPVERDPLPA